MSGNRLNQYLEVFIDCRYLQFGLKTYWSASIGVHGMQQDQDRGEGGLRSSPQRVAWGHRKSSALSQRKGNPWCTMQEGRAKSLYSYHSL